MNIYADFRARVADALAAVVKDGLLPHDLDLSRFVVEPPRDSAHGDLATNAAMVYAKEAKAAGSDSRAVAAALAAKIALFPGVEKTSVAGPGFLNIALKLEVYGEVLKSVLREGARYGADAEAGLPPINVEFVSANPTGPMHVGHARGAVFGDALAGLLEFCGRKVTREYYVNDAGAQVDVLAHSAVLRYREALGEDIGAIPEGLYPGDYLKPLGAALAAEFGRGLLDRGEAETLELVRSRAIEAMMALIKDDLAALNIRHDVFSSERALTGHDGGPDRVRETIEAMRARGIVYVGRLPPPKGAPSEDWEDREQTLFRTSDFGDDVDRPLIKSDGSYTYFASDIAYHKTKLDRGFLELVDVLGADHGGYLKRMQAAVAALSEGKARFDIRFCQLVRLMRAGAPVKMSKRSGEFVTLREVVDETGPDAVRFMMLMRKNDAPLDFDLEKVREQSSDNPVFYVQYAHARCRSVLRQGAAAFPDADISQAALVSADFSRLIDPGERDVMRWIAQFPRAVQQAAEAREPHRLAFFAHDGATVLHALYTKGKESHHLRFVNENDRLQSIARLSLVASVAQVLASCLAVLGVGAPDEMR